MVCLSRLLKRLEAIHLVQVINKAFEEENNNDSTYNVLPTLKAKGPEMLGCTSFQLLGHIFAWIKLFLIELIIVKTLLCFHTTDNSLHLWLEDKWHRSW